MCSSKCYFTIELETRCEDSGDFQKGFKVGEEGGWKNFKNDMGVANGGGG